MAARRYELSLLMLKQYFSASSKAYPSFSVGLLLQLISLLCIHPDFQSWFDGHDSTYHDSTLITWRIASQYVNGCSSAVGSEAVREKSGWQGKLSTKGYKCNEARIPTNAFYLKRKPLLPGKQRPDTEIMITCDQVINLEFDCRVRMYFCRRFHNGRNIINTAKSETVWWFIV